MQYDHLNIAGTTNLNGTLDLVPLAPYTDPAARGTADEFRRQATEIIAGQKARDAFDLSLEDDRKWERYGEGWGQKVLVGRRLVESGVRFVTVGVPGGNVIANWDDHGANGNIIEAMKDRLPWFDQAVMALIEDIYQRGPGPRRNGDG